MLKFFESFVHVPSDEYKFGTNKLNIESEPPANAFKSYLNEYKILRFPVTEALWALIIDDGTPESDYPKVNVNFFEANCYANVLTDLFKKYFPNEFVNKKVTLPNEYQWETAGRSKHEYEYPWGNKFDQSLCNCEMTIGATTKVGKYSPLGDSKFGCHDMAGNVREWTRSYGGTKGIDWKLHSNDNFLNNINIVSSSRLIIKGGSYSYSFDCVVCWMRNTQIASRKDCQTGFRLVIENI